MTKYVFTALGKGIASAVFSKEFDRLDIPKLDLVQKHNHDGTLPARFSAKGCDSGERK